MKYDQARAQSWLRAIDLYLPDIFETLNEVDAEILIIGAAVCDLYQNQGWIPNFKRSTGDIDLSVGLASSVESYDKLKDRLIQAQYKPDARLHYRFHSPKQIVNALNYIDLLAHPSAGTMSDAQVRQLLGVGDGFSFSSFRYASSNAFTVINKVLIPNPFGFLALKRSAYLDDPSGRIKDLADIIEVTSGLVEKGQHFEITELWNKLKNKPESRDVIDMLRSLGEGESPQWDIENANSQLKLRGFIEDEIEETIPRRLLDFAEACEDPSEG